VIEPVIIKDLALRYARLQRCTINRLQKGTLNEEHCRQQLIRYSITQLPQKFLRTLSSQEMKTLFLFYPDLQEYPKSVTSLVTSLDLRGYAPKYVKKALALFSLTTLLLAHPEITDEVINNWIDKGLFKEIENLDLQKNGPLKDEILHKLMTRSEKMPKIESVEVPCADEPTDGNSYDAHNGHDEAIAAKDETLENQGLDSNIDENFGFDTNANYYEDDDMYDDE
jgi:hypothetical protein